jgi:DNA polymerase-1
MMTGPIVFDIETHSANELYAKTPAEFFRIGALSDLTSTEHPYVTQDVQTMQDAVTVASVAIGHNIIAFDLPALGIKDLLERTKARRIIDTWTLATVMDPPPDSYQPHDGARRFPKKPEEYKQYYSLDNLAFQYGVPGKTHDLKKLAKERGDINACCTFGSIPVDDPDYREYLRADVDASRTVLGAMLAKFGPITEYAWREMRVAAIASTLSTNGFRLDRDLTNARIAANEEIRARNTQQLVDKYDLPLTNAQGKPSTKPIATADGKKAVLNALYSVGIQPHELPRTKGNQPSLSATGLQELAEKYPDNTELAFIVEAVAGVQGLRTVYQTALDNTHADGLCHPDVFYLQASGRLSLQNPGLTVFGKRGGRHIEREIFVPDVLWGEDDDLHVLFTADFSQIDARAVAAHSQDYNYLDQFEGDNDLHLANAIATYGAAAVAANPKLREGAKAFGHGWNYNMGLDKLAGIVGDQAARAFWDMMQRQYPRLIQWKTEQVRQAEQYGWIDNGFGRIMKANRDRAFTQGPALVGQGAARDLMFQALLSMDHGVIRMLKAIVHDEVVFSAPMSIAREVRQHVIEKMTFEWAPAHASRPVKIIADASNFGLTWGSLYE